MKSTLFSTFATVLACLLLLAGTACSSQSDTGEESYALLITIDGFPHEALWDERVPIPTIRSLANSGVWSTNMRSSTPSVTWPNHHTLATGVHPEKHGVLTNGIFMRTDGGLPIYKEHDVDRSQLSDYPTFYDLASEQGLRTADVNWPVTRGAETLDDSFPDAVDEMAHTTPELLGELVDLGVLADRAQESFELGQVARDRIWTEAAVHLIRERRPNVMLFHLLNVDWTHHQFGKGTNPGNTALAYADANIRMVLDALEEAGIRDRTTIFLASDHGFRNVTRQVQPNVLLKQAGLLQTDADGAITGGRVQVVPNGGSAMVFAVDPERREEDLRVARELLEQAEGIEHVLSPEEYPAYGLPQPDEDPQMGDLLISAAEGYSINMSAVGSEPVRELGRVQGVHGYLSDTADMKTIFIASGYGIRSGVELESVDNRSVAPTVARILGLELTTADGPVLERILVNGSD